MESEAQHRPSPIHDCSLVVQHMVRIAEGSLVTLGGMGSRVNKNHLFRHEPYFLALGWSIASNFFTIIITVFFSNFYIITSIIPSKSCLENLS